jgi:hypothetical protein
MRAAVRSERSYRFPPDTKGELIAMSQSTAADYYFWKKTGACRNEARGTSAEETTSFSTRPRGL